MRREPRAHTELRIPLDDGGSVTLIFPVKMTKDEHRLAGKLIRRCWRHYEPKATEILKAAEATP